MAEQELYLSDKNPVGPYILGVIYFLTFVVVGFYVVTAAPFL